METLSWLTLLLSAVALALLAHLVLLVRDSQRESREARRDFLDFKLSQASTLNQQLLQWTESNATRLQEIRNTLETQLQRLQTHNEQKLEEIRRTVDEKLQATLETRLGASFRQVAERLEQVHRGLGEMQGLARDVSSLHRVFSNVKTRGIFGEMQLASLLEQVLTTDQYASNVETIPGSNTRVEFAIRMPMQQDNHHVVWLPIDAKFPREDYERLLDAQDRGDLPSVEVSSKALEVRLRAQAKDIREKYIALPYTTDFGILFLPTESLYAEVLRRPGLAEGLQRDFRVILSGPTTLLAILSSLQMGFRTLALAKRSTEVWDILSTVKTEFARFGEALAKTKKKIEEAGSSIDATQIRTRQMARALREVESSPASLAIPNLEEELFLPLPD